MQKLFSVCFWLTHPDNENDDCMTGTDFATESEARDCMSNPENYFKPSAIADCPFIELDGPNVHEITERPGVAKRARRNRALDDAAERSERAMQAGMAFGVDAYNEAMGWDVE